MARPSLAAGSLALVVVAMAGGAAALDRPDAATLLSDLGFSSGQVDRVRSGSIVSARIEPSSERELVVAFAFRMARTPTELIAQMRAGLIDRMVLDTNVHLLGVGAPTLASFAPLTLGLDAQKGAQTYANAQPGRDLNLSRAEIARFDALRGSPLSAVEHALRGALLERLQAYQARGLAGIDPYARSDGALRSAGDELRSATLATKPLHALLTAVLPVLLDYPAHKPPGTEEAYGWTQDDAHGVPTFSLMHSLAVPAGGAWVVARRQFYVSNRYNCAQSIAGYLPMQGGTLVIYTHRTSTDGVTGFGADMKRGIGSRLLARRLEDLYGRIQASVQ